MKKFNIKMLVLTLMATFLVTGCTKDFEDINTDPNRSKDAPATNVLAFVLRYHSDTFYDAWNNLNEPSTYGGHIAKIQYIDEARYNYRPGVVENKWYYTYIQLNNLNEIKKKAIADGANNMLGVAKIMEAYIFQIATDTWRDVPFFDAIKLSEGILLPRYDRQEDIYPELLKILAEANDLLASGTDNLGEGDVLFGGNILKWRKFANSLRLRLAMRISEVSSALAKSTVETILGNPADNPIMSGNADNAFFWYPGAAPYEDTWFKDSKTRDDHGMSDVLINVLLDLNDPRLPVYAKPATADGEYRGFTIGASAQPNIATISRIGARFRDDPAGFSPFMHYSETMFHVAEAALKNFNTGISAKDAYEIAVTASLEDNGIAQADIDNYLSGSGSYDGTLNQIYLQEWIALFKQGMEAWSLYRRTGIPTTHYVAPGSIFPGHNSPPFRYPYPQNELTLNGANSQPFADEVQDYFWGKQMWWDTRTGVH
ncbi:MAG: SusD/RagB family nutrient-binding outer membrane lipoprotein [Bacteroidales bacterium]